MVTQSPQWTVADFDAYTPRPEHGDPRFEYIGGAILNEPSNAFASQMAARISGYVFIFLQQLPIAHLTGEAGSFMVSGEGYALDVAVTPKARQAKFTERGYNPRPPDLAVEVEHPTDAITQYNLHIKVANYLAAGTTEWVIRDETQN